ncbi:hypothetical protein M404DRAFT_29660 [Pisolithus tinctorius Marx 270]|uniref:Uncharacterized protein n=1 Tax=Pisolithus tinctorius Marx 270 TaxID=870435 RepID=A0A0C3NYQ3_PISTI|nr:hypothetical protein M404DRAFT_29660 [Pisolithus tinctorius Marx 270]
MTSMPTSTNPMTPRVPTSIAMPVPLPTSHNHRYAPPERYAPYPPQYPPTPHMVVPTNPFTTPSPPPRAHTRTRSSAQSPLRRERARTPPRYDPTFRACNTPPLSQAGYRSPSPLPRAGPSAPEPSLAPASTSAPAVTPAAPSTGKWVAPEASVFLGYVRLLNDFERWESHGWRAGEHHEHLRVLSKIFRSSEVISKRMHDQVAMAEGSFEAHTYEDIDKANSTILQETLKTQEAVVKIRLEDQAYLRTLTERKHGRSREKKPVSEGRYNMDPEEAERLAEMSNRGVAIAGRRLYRARVENTSRPSRTRSHPSRSTDRPVTGSTFSLRPEVIPLEEPSSTLLRHQELYQQLPSSPYLSPLSARENLVGSFPSIGSIPSISSPATDVRALDIGRLTAQLAVATNSEIRSWVQQGLYPPSEDLRP